MLESFAAFGFTRSLVGISVIAGLALNRCWHFKCSVCCLAFLVATDLPNTGLAVYRCWHFKCTVCCIALSSPSLAVYRCWHFKCSVCCPHSWAGRVQMLAFVLSMLHYIGIRTDRCWHPCLTCCCAIALCSTQDSHAMAGTGTPGCTRWAVHCLAVRLLHVLSWSGDMHRL